MTGMLDDRGWMLVDCPAREHWVWRRSSSGGSPPEGYGPRGPALNDPATLGCIEHGLLPEAWPGTMISVKRWMGPDGKVMADLHVFDLDDACTMLFSSVDVPLGEALAAALEAAP